MPTAARTMPKVAPKRAADPIFTAIEIHREAWDVYVRIDNTEPRNPALHKRAGKAADHALGILMDTVPTTLAGIRAALAYFVEFDKGCVPNTSGEYLPTLLLSPVFAAETMEGVR